jgi:hypothetical protein
VGRFKRVLNDNHNIEFSNENQFFSDLKSERVVTCKKSKIIRKEIPYICNKI